MKRVIAPASGGSQRKTRAEGEGTIRPFKIRLADGRVVPWREGLEGTVTLFQGRRRVTIAGKSERPTVYGVTRREVGDQLATIRGDVKDGVSPKAGKDTLAAHVAEYLPVLQRASNKPSAYRRNEELLRLHVLGEAAVPGVPYIGNRKLGDLFARPKLIDDLYSALHTCRAHNTIVHVHVALHKALQQAVAWGKIPANPADRVVKPKLRKVNIQPLDAEQAKHLREVARDDDLEAFWILALTHGFREGELLALRWCNITSGDMVSVTHSLARAKGVNEYELGQPKTDKGNRKVRLSAVALKALERHRQRAENPSRDAFIFTRPGTPFPLDADRLSRAWWALRKRAGLPEKTRVHDLRHTAATLLLLQNVHVKVVSEMLGHASIAITLDLYSHVLPDMQQAAVDAIDRLYPDAA